MTAVNEAQTGRAVALPWLEQPLAELLRRQRGHAVLLAAPQGLGLFDLGLALARSWLCENRRAGGLACGACASCQLVQARTHPDLLVLLPEALQEPLGWATTDEGDARASKAKPSREIKVEALRRAVEFAQQTTSRGVAKVVLIHPAEQMNAISANTLLKTLEEPPGAARFVLCSEAVDALLPTIRSRCQIVPLHAPDEATARRWLEEQGVMQADLLLAAAGGQPLAALDLARAGIDAAHWVQLPERLMRGEAQAVSGWPAPLLVQTLQKLCHDALAVAVGAQPRYFPATSFAGIGGSVSALTAWSAQLRRVARHEDHPWNAPLLLDALVAQAMRHLNSPQ